MKFDPEKIREFLRANLLLVIVVAVILVLLVFFYIPRLSALSAVKKEFERDAETLRSNHELIDKLVDIGAEHQAAKVELERLRREHAGHHHIPDMLHSLTAAIVGLNADLSRINRSPQEKKAYLVKVPLELEIEAGYRSLAEYIDRITRIARLIDVRRIEISHDTASYPRLKVKLLIDAYFLEDGGGE